MTQTDIATLKEQIKAELLAEMAATKSQSHWHPIRNRLESELSHLGTQEKYQTIGAVSTIIRHTLGIKAIARLQEDQVERATAIAARILEAMNCDVPTGTEA